MLNKFFHYFGVYSAKEKCIMVVKLLGAMIIGFFLLVLLAAFMWYCHDMGVPM